MIKRLPLSVLWKIVAGNYVALSALFVGTLVPLLIFGKLSQDAKGTQGLWWDIELLHFIHRSANSQLDTGIAQLTILGGVLAIPAILLMSLLIRLLVQRPVSALFFVVSVCGAWALDIGAKLAFQRTRPTLWVSPLPESDYSFPSGHAMVSMAIALSLVLLAWPTRLRWPTSLCASVGTVLVGWSRLYLGVHYPSDIIAGWCAALLWVTGLHFILYRRSTRQFTQPFEERSQLTS